MDVEETRPPHVVRWLHRRGFVRTDREVQSTDGGDVATADPFVPPLQPRSDPSLLAAI